MSFAEAGPQQEVISVNHHSEAVFCSWKPSMRWQGGRGHSRQGPFWPIILCPAMARGGQHKCNMILLSPVFSQCLLMFSSGAPRACCTLSFSNQRASPPGTLPSSLWTPETPSKHHPLEKTSWGPKLHLCFHGAPPPFVLTLVYLFASLLFCSSQGEVTPFPVQNSNMSLHKDHLCVTKAGQVPKQTDNKSLWPRTNFCPLAEGS